MDEAAKYQQRVEAIAERRRRAEDESRQTEDERLRTAQEKRRFLRDRWFSDEVVEQREDLTAQRMFHDAGPGGRSVLGMVAVQVERDPITGATVVRSVAPVSPGVTAPGVTAPGVTAPGVTAVFDDGRKSIHAVGGAGKTPPSSEELGQILSIVDGVGMKVLLDDVAVTTPKTPKTENADAAGTPREHVVTFSTQHATPKVDDAKDDGEERSEDDGEERSEDDGEDGAEDGAEDEERGVTSVRDVSGDVGNVDELRLDEGPVTLVFLGYSDAADQDGGGGEDEDGVITVERVIISEDGEETLVAAAAPRGGRKFQEVPLDGNGVQKEEDEEEDEEDEASSSRRTDGDDTKSKRKRCRCCSVM